MYKIFYCIIFIVIASATLSGSDTLFKYDEQWGYPPFWSSVQLNNKNCSDIPEQSVVEEKKTWKDKVILFSILGFACLYYYTAYKIISFSCRTTFSCVKTAVHYFRNNNNINYQPYLIKAVTKPLF
jgi:hypothetical protein